MGSSVLLREGIRAPCAATPQPHAEITTVIMSRAMARKVHVMQSLLLACGTVLEEHLGSAYIGQ